MTPKERDTIIVLTKKNYNLVGCHFPMDGRELVEYLYESEHPDEHRALIAAITAHNTYNSDDLTEDDFFDWHGL